MGSDVKKWCFWVLNFLWVKMNKIKQKLIISVKERRGHITDWHSFESAL